METRLSDWSPESLLVVGNDAAGRLPTSWRGEISRLDIWDHALPQGTGADIIAGKPRAIGDNPRAAYDFSAPPFPDRYRFLPSLEWAARDIHDGPTSPAKSVLLNGSSWLVSDRPVTNLVEDIRKKNQFAIRVVCTPSEITGANGRIVSVSRGTGPVDLQIRQDDSNLVLWFRNALLTKRTLLAWYVPHVFTLNQQRDILFSYDGSVISLYIDGSRRPREYRLGPGTALARFFRKLKPGEINGYNDIYYFLVFFPGGALLGIAAQPMRSRGLHFSLCATFALLAPPFLIECALILASGHSISMRNVTFSIILSVAGWLWINADRRRFVKLSGFFQSCRVLADSTKNP